MPCDNALAESFFATLECELLDRVILRTRAEARPVVFDYIEGFYNLHRRHSGIDYLSPIEYERRNNPGSEAVEEETDFLSGSLSHDLIAG